jgi:hypothetical protein
MEKQEAVDWLEATLDELLDDGRRLAALLRTTKDGAPLRRSDLDDLEAAAHNLELDVQRFKHRLPQ